MLYKNLPTDELGPVMRWRALLDGVAALKFLLAFDWQTSRLCCVPDVNTTKRVRNSKPTANTICVWLLPTASTFRNAPSKAFCGNITPKAKSISASWIKSANRINHAKNGIRVFILFELFHNPQVYRLIHHRYFIFSLSDNHKPKYTFPPHACFIPYSRNLGRNPTRPGITISQQRGDLQHPSFYCRRNTHCPPFSETG